MRSLLGHLLSRSRPLTLRLGHTKLWFWSPRLSVRHFDDIIELNQHMLYPYYSHGGPRMWPTYAVCIKCGHSILNGADAWFAAVPCGEMD